MEQENAQLKNDITRLNGIIDAILLQNRILLNEINRLTNGVSPEQVVSSVATLTKGRTHADSSVCNLPEGRIQVGSSVCNLPEGRTDVDSSICHLPEGRTGVDSSVCNLPEGRIQTGSSVCNLPEGRTDAGSSVSTLPNAGSFPNNVIPAIEATPIAVSRLFDELIRTKDLHRVRHDGVTHMAMVILQAHNGQSCSHQDLRKLTGLSESGIAKLMISMKKRGMIFRTGYKRFAVSEGVKQVLKKALENKNSSSWWSKAA